MSESDRQWYVRRGSAVQGPYSLSQIQRYLLLGRVRLTDRVSENGESWTRITQRPDMIPSEMSDLGTEEGLARYEAARLALDEREPQEDARLLVGGERSADPIPTDDKDDSILTRNVVVTVLLVMVAVLLTVLLLRA
jgi:hypothetical protein